MIREARAGDERAMLAFLGQRATTSMFLRNNLLQFGLFNRADPKGTTFHLYETNGTIAGVFGRANYGYLMCQCPDAPQPVWDAFAQTLIGHTLAGITGEVEQIEQAMRALCFPEAAVGLNRTEPFYELALTELAQSKADIRQPETAHIPFLSEWFRHYLLETGIEQDTPALKDVAAERARIATLENNVRLLFVQDKPVAMTGINARADDTVQIGGVYVPKEFRGQGLAGRCLAAHLKELEQDGITQAVLFAASAAAAKAYEAIGFRHTGYYQMALLAERYIYQGPA